jgi:histidinol-phosphate aminotransferase
MLYQYKEDLNMVRHKSSILRRKIEEARNLGIYNVGETIGGLADKLGRKTSEITKLNSNENFFVPIEFLRSTLIEVVEKIDPRIYPRDEVYELKKMLSKELDFQPGNIVIGSGSDQLIDLVSRMMLTKDDEAISISPTFSIYKRCVKLQGGKYKDIPLMNDFSLNLKSIQDSITPKTKLIFLCSPNNPTANQFKSQEIRYLAEEFEGLIAIDEAYVDFSSGSTIDLIRKHDNLIIFRTFSKVYGLAGLRLGYAVLDSELAEILDRKFQMPYSVTLLALNTAMKLLERKMITNSAIIQMKKCRQFLINHLAQLKGVEVFDSETNFVLFKVKKKSEMVYRRLLEKGVIIRNIGRVLNHDNCLRVTVAPYQIMDKFLVSLNKVLD